MNEGNYEVTLALPADNHLPVIHGKWERTAEGISATYTKDELAWCLWLGDIWNKPRFAKKQRGR